MLGEVKNQQGETLDYTLHNAGGGKGHLVIIGHGVTGNKDRPFIVALAEALDEAGIPALRFSFSGNGASGGEFTASTITKEVADLKAMVKATKNEGFGRIAFAGHSMGGAVGVLSAADDSQIDALVSLAGMVNTKDFALREFGDETPDEGTMWDDPACPLSKAFMDDLCGMESVAGKAGGVTMPWLLVHGTDDDVVPISDSREIYALASEPKKLAEIAGADHVFSGEATDKMIKAVIPWLKEKLA